MNTNNVLHHGLKSGQRVRLTADFDERYVAGDEGVIVRGKFGGVTVTFDKDADADAPVLLALIARCDDKTPLVSKLEPLDEARDFEIVIEGLSGQSRKMLWALANEKPVESSTATRNALAEDGLVVVASDGVAVSSDGLAAANVLVRHVAERLSDMALDGLRDLDTMNSDDRHAVKYILIEAGLIERWGTAGAWQLTELGKAVLAYLDLTADIDELPAPPTPFDPAVIGMPIPDVLPDGEDLDDEDDWDDETDGEDLDADEDDLTDGEDLDDEPDGWTAEYDDWLAWVARARVQVDARHAEAEADEARYRRERDLKDGEELREALKVLGFDPGVLERGEWYSPDNVRVTLLTGGFYQVLGDFPDFTLRVVAVVDVEDAPFMVRSVRVQRPRYQEIETWDERQQRLGVALLDAIEAVKVERAVWMAKQAISVLAAPPAPTSLTVEFKTVITFMDTDAAREKADTALAALVSDGWDIAHEQILMYRDEGDNYPQRVIRLKRDIAPVAPTPSPVVADSDYDDVDERVAAAEQRAIEAEAALEALKAETARRAAAAYYDLQKAGLGQKAIWELKQVETQLVSYARRLEERVAEADKKLRDAGHVVTPLLPAPRFMVASGNARHKTRAHHHHRRDD